MIQQTTGKRDMKRYHVIYIPGITDDNNDVSTTYLGYYKSKGEERTFPVDNHIPIDGRGDRSISDG